MYVPHRYEHPSKNVLNEFHTRTSTFIVLVLDSNDGYSSLQISNNNHLLFFFFLSFKGRACSVWYVYELLTKLLYLYQWFMAGCLCSPETGFLDDVSYDTISLGPGYDRPYQFNPTVREPKTIQLYKHLNLKSCIWTFDAYYDMTELIDVCGGSVTADFQVDKSLDHFQNLRHLEHSSSL